MTCSKTMDTNSKYVVYAITHVVHFYVWGLFWTDFSESWTSGKWNNRFLRKEEKLETVEHSDCCKTGCRLPFKRIIPAAPRVLSDCGCTTRNMAWRPYVKGTQARSPNANMNPNPSCTMSIVVSTASCRHKEKYNVVHVGLNFLSPLWMNFLSFQTRLVFSYFIPQCICHIEELETVDKQHGKWWRVPQLYFFH